MVRRKQLRNPTLLALRKMTHYAFTAESCTASLAKSYDIGFAVKAAVRNGLMHYVHELQPKTNISFVKYVYSISLRLAYAMRGYCVIVLYETV